MSKIGDLIVRLQLKYQDYQKGLKKAEKDTKGFAATLGKLKGVGLAVWGAVGAGAVAMAKKFIQHSQTMSDKWNVGVNQMKAVWDQFLTSLTTWNWEGFGQRIKDAMDAAIDAITMAEAATYKLYNEDEDPVVNYMNIHNILALNSSLRYVYSNLINNLLLLKFDTAVGWHINHACKPNLGVCKILTIVYEGNA